MKRKHDDIAETMQTGGLMPKSFFDDNFPSGYRFEPTDQELLEYYLRKKVMGIHLPAHQIIDANVYAQDPEILAGSREEVLYFFTPKDGNSAAFDGSWKATGPVIPIMKEEDGQTIGLKKEMEFFQEDKKTEWTMVEYTLNSNVYLTKEFEEWALCKLYKKSWTEEGWIPLEPVSPIESVDQNFVAADADADTSSGGSP